MVPDKKELTKADIVKICVERVSGEVSPHDAAKKPALFSRINTLRDRQHYLLSPSVGDWAASRYR